MARRRRTSSLKTGKQVKFWATVIATAVREDAPTLHKAEEKPNARGRSLLKAVPRVFAAVAGIVL